MVHFPIGLDFLSITFTFLLHLLLSWTSSLSISSAAISASTLSNHVFLGLPTGLLPHSEISVFIFFLESFLCLETDSNSHPIFGVMILLNHVLNLNATKHVQF